MVSPVIAPNLLPDGGLADDVQSGVIASETERGVREMTEQEEMTEHHKRYQETLKAARERDPEVDLVLDTTAEDVNWIRGKRRGGHVKTSDPKRGRGSGGRRERPREP